MHVNSSSDLPLGLNSAERPIKGLAPLNEKHFCLFLKIFFGSFMSVEVFLRFLEVNLDFSVERLLHMYCGASS